MNISLNADQELFIQEQIARGNYQSADELIDSALKALAQKQREYNVWMQDVRVKVDAAAASLERGEGLDGEVVVNQILNRFQAAREGQ
jgi:antitoxin ParD1/3/4